MQLTIKTLKILLVNKNVIISFIETKKNLNSLVYLSYLAKLYYFKISSFNFFNHLIITLYFSRTVQSSQTGDNGPSAAPHAVIRRE